MNTENIILNNGAEMPMIGFGVFQISPEETERRVGDALSEWVSTRACHCRSSP